MGLAYANPHFSLLAKVLTKFAYEGGRVVMCTPDWGCSGEHAYWRRMLDLITVGRVQLPDAPIYVPEDSDTAIQAPEWASFLSIVDGSLNPVPLCDLDQVLLKVRFGIGFKKCNQLFPIIFRENNRLFRLLPLQIISFFRSFCKK